MSHNAQINMRVTKKDLALIDRAAAQMGKSRSAYLRDCAEAKAKEILRGRKTKKHRRNSGD